MIYKLYYIFADKVVTRRGYKRFKSDKFSEGILKTDLLLVCPRNCVITNPFFYTIHNPQESDFLAPYIMSENMLPLFHDCTKRQVVFAEHIIKA